MKSWHGSASVVTSGPGRMERKVLTMIKVKVYGVAQPYAINTTPILLLTDEQEERILILTIGLPEAMAISTKLTDEVPPPRPQTHDLMKSIFEHFQAKIRNIIITALRDATFYAEISVDVNGHSIVIDSRPSDAIALALRVGAPIFVSDEVWTEASDQMPKDKFGAAEKMEVKAAEAKAREAEEIEDDSPLAVLRRRLQTAIDEERYELAAQIRDEIRKLEEQTRKA
ncbi:MAG: bifunctional nuclease family protein [Candidatus Latescibacteria bacterium]|nr:bifunctional nuclease family protein [Candidatus Latescibacterota bacterium]